MASGSDQLSPTSLRDLSVLVNEPPPLREVMGIMMPVGSLPSSPSSPRWSQVQSHHLPSHDLGGQQNGRGRGRGSGLQGLEGGRTCSGCLLT